MGERNTAVLLQEWGVWLKQDSGFNLRARSAMQMIYDPVGDECYHPAAITDDDALEVDRAVARLKLYRPEFFRVLWLACVSGFSMRAVSDALGISRETAAKYYECGYTWVDCSLNMNVYFSMNNDFQEFLQAA
jgi:hypothetical protein